MANPKKLSQKISFVGGMPVQMLTGNGTRVNATAAAASTAEAALPSGGAGGVVIVRAADYIWIRFGATGMGAAAAGTDSILFPGGEAPISIPSAATHFRVIRFGSSDVTVQLEAVALEAAS